MGSLIFFQIVFWYGMIYAHQLRPCHILQRIWLVGHVMCQYGFMVVSIFCCVEIMVNGFMDINAYFVYMV